MYNVWVTTLFVPIYKCLHAITSYLYKYYISFLKIYVDNYYYIINHKVINYFRLYLGYLPINITINAIKDEFPKAYRVVIGYGKIIVSTR